MFTLTARCLDVVFPAHAGLEGVLKVLETVYTRGKVKLSEVLGCAPSFLQPFSGTGNAIFVTTSSSDTEDIWCIDQRGLLTFVLSKETYERLGLVGVKRHGKRRTEQHLVQVDLHDRTSNAFMRAKDAFKIWDEWRDRDGTGAWEVLYHISSVAESDTPPFFATASHILHPVTCHTQTLPDVHIPTPALPPNPKSTTRKSGSAVQNSTDEAALLEDWNADISELFEWVGMACLGAQRLKANDRANAFVALYEPPSPSHVGDVTHLRWRGLLPPSFSQSVIDAALNPLLPGSATEGSAPSSPPAFIAITANAFSHTPVTYIAPAAFAEGASEEVRNKLPSRAVSCWSMVVAPSSHDSRNSQGGDDTVSSVTHVVEERQVKWVLAVMES